MSLQSKIQEALSAGVPAGDLTSVLRNNAMKARDAKVRGALMSAGQTAAGIASKNQAGLITQAGLGNQSFTPATGAQAALGEGAKQVGQAQADYQGELSNIARDEQARKDRLAKEEADRQFEKDKAEAEDLKGKEELKKAQEAQIRYAKNAIILLGKGGGKVLNFAVSPAVTKAIRATGIAVARASGSQNFNDREYLEETKPEVITYWFQNHDQASLSAFTDFKTDVYNLYVEGRKRLAGQGQITEKESALIYETVASLNNNSDSVASALQYLIDKISFELGRPTEKVPYTSVPVFNKEVTADELGIGVGLSDLPGTGGSSNSETQKPTPGQTEAPLIDPNIELPPSATPTETTTTTAEPVTTTVTEPTVKPGKFDKFLEGTSIDLPGTKGGWFEISSNSVPEAVRKLGAGNKNKVVSDQGYRFVLYDASNWDLTGSQWYIQKQGG